MPTHEAWITDAPIIETIWEAPLTSAELKACFKNLAELLDERTETTHILFDLDNAGHVPADAPVSAISSGFLKKDHLDRVAVIGMDIVPQILAQVAMSVSQQDIKFFPLRQSALDYLNAPED